MAQQAAGGGGGGNNNSDNENGADDVSRVYRAVAAGETAARARRSAAVNYKSSTNGNETTLEAAHDLERCDIVGALLKAGADATALSPKCNALALAIHYGETETLRVLLRSGRHQANECLRYGFTSDVRGNNSDSDDSDDDDDDPAFCLPAHLAVAPPRRSVDSDCLPPAIDALAVLRESGADINGQDALGRAPLHWAARLASGHRVRVVDALLSPRADVDARDDHGRTPLFMLTSAEDASELLRLLLLGASADVLDSRRVSPLMLACSHSIPTARVAVPALLRASSRETRCAIDLMGDMMGGAIERLVLFRHYTETWCQDVIAKLLSSGTPVQPEFVPRVLPIAARHATRLERRVAAHEHDPPPWQVHEAMVELAFDFQDVRAAVEGVRERERGVQELEDELRALGVGTEDTDESDESDEEEGESG